MAGKKKTSRIQEEDIPVETKKQKTEEEVGDDVVEEGNGHKVDDDKNQATSNDVVSQPKEDKVDDNNKPSTDEVVQEDVKVSESSGKQETGGRLLICGGTNWDLIGRKELPKSAKNGSASAETRNLWGPHVWSENIRIQDIISSCCAVHSVLITADGKAMTFGRNDKGQLGLGDTITRNTPEIVKGLEGETIVSAATGKGHTLFLTDKGVVYSCGENKMGQLGHGNQSPQVTTPTKISYTGKAITRVACGGEFSMIVDVFGNLYTFGSPEYGQLGHNSEGKYFTAGNKISFHCETTPRRVVLFVEKQRDGHSIPVEDVNVKEIAAGVNHAVCIDSKKRVFSWGFAGYGRLGHSETKNELIPRNLKSFDYVRRGAMKICCGSTSCLAVDESGLLYFWGQTKSSGEATMYPKPVQDLSGWNIRSLGHANKSIVVCADNSVISWGPSPTYGELGYGENKAKSSTIPQEMKLLDGIHVEKVTCGYGHTLLLAREETSQDKERIERLPKWP